MKKIVLATAIASFLLVAAQAHAGGWGKGHGSPITVSPTIGVAPSVSVGKVDVLNNVLSGNAIASGNSVQGVLNGNSLGLLNGNALGILGGNSYKLTKKR